MEEHSILRVLEEPRGVFWKEMACPLRLRLFERKKRLSENREMHVQQLRGERGPGLCMAL